jgi:hypothetical protein
MQMSSNPATLKDIYAAAGRAADYFERTGPDLHLYRAQTNDDFEKKVFVLEPSKADVRTENRDGKIWVLGCSAVKGKYHTGVSTFDKQVLPTKNHTRMYEIPKKVDLPEGLAITKDNFNKTFNATHYSLAPKNDMQMELFIQSLKVVADACKIVDEEAKAK